LCGERQTSPTPASNAPGIVSAALEETVIDGAAARLAVNVRSPLVVTVAELVDSSPRVVLTSAAAVADVAADPSRATVFVRSPDVVTVADTDPESGTEPPATVKTCVLRGYIRPGGWATTPGEFVCVSVPPEMRSGSLSVEA